ncbi:hypothetical protein [Gymnodinialimonas ulvae]|uniref:hypothetical protein n=1 Tax=Gymnodinialimonas ulvae TaxID=3126504 RepID=UPI0030AA05F9
MGPLSLASALAAIWFAVHLILGGRQIAGPLRRSGLDPIVRDTQYLCWHFTSVAIAAMALFFALAAILGESAYAVAGLVLAAGFWISGVGIVVAIGQSHAKLPQGWLFLPVAALGLWGIVG